MRWILTMERTPGGWKVIARIFPKTDERGSILVRNALPPLK